MKKLFMFLAVAGLATFGTSCGSDDNKGGDDPAQKALVLSSDVTSVEKGGSVAFTVKVENKVEAGAELYIGDTKIANPAKFDNVGKFKVVAKKNGFVTSNAVEITVTEAGTGEPEPGVETLVLTGSTAAGEVAVGANLSFFMTDAEGGQVSGAKIFKNGTEINGSEYVVAAADAETTLKFTAKKGDLVSNEIVYTVKAIPATPESNFIQIGNDVYAGNYSRLMANCVKEGDQFFISISTVTTDEGETLEYAVFHSDMRNVVDGEATALARTSYAVFQDPASNNIIFPGPDADMQLIESWSVNLEDTVVEYVMPAEGSNGDFTKFNVTKTNAKIAAANADGAFDMDQNYTVTTVGVIDVTPGANAARLSANKSKSVNQKVQTLKTFKKRR